MRTLKSAQEDLILFQTNEPQNWASEVDRKEVNIELVKAPSVIQKEFHRKLESMKGRKSLEVFRPRTKTAKFDPTPPYNIWETVRSEKGSGKFSSLLAIFNEFLDCITMMGYMKETECIKTRNFRKSILTINFIAKKYNNRCFGELLDLAMRAKLCPHHFYHERENFRGVVPPHLPICATPHKLVYLKNSAQGKQLVLIISKDASSSPFQFLCIGLGDALHDPSYGNGIHNGSRNTVLVNSSRFWVKKDCCLVPSIASIVLAQNWKTLAMCANS